MDVTESPIERPKKTARLLQWQETQAYAEGYQGLAKLHPYRCTPTKKPAKSKLDKAERQYNQMLASLRIVAEHTNRRLKVWRILAERYRNRRRRFGLRFNLIAVRCFADTARVVNLELARSS